MTYLSRSKLEDIDLLSKRYGVKPNSFLKDDISDYQFDSLVASVGIEAERKAQEKAQRKNRRGK